MYQNIILWSHFQHELAKVELFYKITKYGIYRIKAHQGAIARRPKIKIL